MKKCALLGLLYLVIVSTAFSASNKKYINVNFGDGDSVSLWCDEDTEEGLYSFSYLGYEWKCDANGKIVYCKDGDSELWFDEKGNNYYSKISDLETWNEFDKSGNIIHSTTNWGAEFWYEYSGNKLIHSFDSLGFETYYEYDTRGRITYKKLVSSNDWEERRYEYNVAISDGKSKTELSSRGVDSGTYYLGYLGKISKGDYKVHVTKSNGEEYYEEYTSEGVINRRYNSSFDIFFCEDGSILNRSEIDSDGNEKVFDSNNQLVLQKEVIDLGTWGKSYRLKKFEYYPTGIVSKTTLRNDSIDYINEYDVYGNLIHSYSVYVGSGRKEESNEVFYEYDSKNVLTYKKELIYEKMYEHWYDAEGKEIKEKTSNRW